MMIARSFAVLVPLAAFASHFAHAFRHKIEATIDVVAATVDADSAFDVVNDSAAEDTTNDLGSTGRPPSTDKFTRAFEAVIAGKVQKHQATMAAAMEAMQNLGSATPGAPSAVSGKDNNTHKRNETLRLTNLLAEANVEKKRAEDVRAYVESMVTACKDLFAQVKRHEKESARRDDAEKAKGAKQTEAALAKIRRKIIEAEARDLKNLLAKVAAIQKAQEEVVQLDARVKAGATEGMAAATQGVYDFTGTLEARNRAVAKKESLDAWPPLQADEEQAKIEKEVQKGEGKASEALRLKQEEHARVFQQAMAQMNVMAGSTKASNKTEMDALTQQLFEANIGKANSEELHRAVTKTIELINAFFTIFNAFKEQVPLRMAEANAGAAQAQQDIESGVRTAVDKADLKDISGFFYFYQVIWTRYMEAEAQMPAEDKEYEALKSEMKKLARDVHVWLNTEMLPYCKKHGSCQDVRGRLMTLLEDDSLWCSERTLQQCKTMKHGRQPNGKMCSWHSPSDVGHASYAHVTDGSSQGAWNPPGSGKNAGCKQNNPPTTKLKFGRDSESPEGPGIFH